jgi:beta-lactamase class A
MRLLPYLGTFMPFRAAFRLCLPALAATAILASCSGSHPPETPAIKVVADPSLLAVANQAKPGILGAAVLNLKTHQLSSVNGDMPLPLQSVFKLPLGIYVMHLAQQGKIALDEQVTLSKSNLSIFYSPIAEGFDARQVYTVRELVAATVSDSDNTAADWLLERVGGPEALTRFFRNRGFRHFRVDRYERELQPESVGLPLSSGRLPDADAYRRYRSEVPMEVRRAGMQRYLSDPRDRMSANDAVRMLAMLDAGQLLNAANTMELMKVLLATPSGPDRLKAGAPNGALVYHKTGSSADVEALNGATNDIGIISLPDGTRLAVAAFLSGSSLPADDRARVLASVAEAATRRQPYK